MRTIPALAALLPLLFPWPVAEAQHWPAEPPQALPDAQTLALLREGEVLVENTNLDESGGAAIVQALFRGSSQRVWALLEDCQSNYQFVDGLRDCELLEATETSAVTRQAVKKHLLAPRMEYTFETARVPFRWIAIRLIEGDLRQMEGSWRFDPLDGGQTLLVTHRIQVQPRMRVPRWLVRRALRKDLGDMVACMRALAAASGSEQDQRKDQQRCP